MQHLTKEQQLARAIELLKTARRAPFYREKYRELGEIDSLEAWQRVPLLSRNDLYVHTYPATRDMLTAPLANAIVSSTGGSSGVARTIVLTHHEWDRFCAAQGEAFRLLGVQPDDVVANLFIAGHLWPSFLGVHEMIKQSGGVHLPISANIGVEEAFALCKKYQPSVIVSLPTLFVFMADLAKKEGITFPNLRLIAYAGEQLSREAEAHVRRHLGVKEIKALAYSSADCGIMGYQCPQCGFATYHAPSSMQMVEIVHPDTLQPVKEGETGEVVITSLARELQPLIRYRIGDMATLLSEQCPCGDPNPLFVLKGRTGEDFKLGGAYVTIGVFERAVSEFSNVLSMNFQLTLDDVANQMDVLLDVESSDPLQSGTAVEALRQRLMELVPEIKVGTEMGFIRRYEVHAVELGSLPRNSITGKIKKVIDKRVI